MHSQRAFLQVRSIRSYSPCRFDSRQRDCDLPSICYIGTLDKLEEGEEEYEYRDLGEILNALAAFDDPDPQVSGASK